MQLTNFEFFGQQASYHVGKSMEFIGKKTLGGFDSVPPPPPCLGFTAGRCILSSLKHTV